MAKRPRPPPQDPSGTPAIHAPWRADYLDAIGDAEKSSGPPADSTGSFIRAYWLAPQDDLRNHVIRRTAEGLIFLNRFPYAGGHLLVALGEPRPRILDYSPAQRAALWSLVDTAADLIERALEPQGINIGVNQGRAAGAGVPQHIHIHLVPRWGGDVNFMAVVGGVRVISAGLDRMAERYRAAIRATPPPSPRTVAPP
jgi:ATP adenylyltransferase